MNTEELLMEVKKEINRLQQVVNLLENTGSQPRTRKKRKPMSQEARAKIAAAQKKRWAKTKG
jgi:hypothetical protein